MGEHASRVDRKKGKRNAQRHFFSSTRILDLFNYEFVYNKDVENRNLTVSYIIYVYSNGFNLFNEVV